VPGTPVYSLKVLDGNGKGSLSQVLEAVQWAAAEGLRLGIKVLNLSLAASLDPNSEDYEATRAYICNTLKLASDAGIAVVIAAGNYAQDLHYYLPANCPGVASVTGEPALPFCAAAAATAAAAAAAEHHKLQSSGILCHGTCIGAAAVFSAFECSCLGTHIMPYPLTCSTMCSAVVALTPWTLLCLFVCFSCCCCCCRCCRCCCCSR
jgi:hypothetical protein